MKSLLRLLSVAPLLASVALAADDLTFDKPCVDRFLRLAFALKHGDTRSVVAQKLEALGKPRTLTNGEWYGEYGFNRDDVGLYWLCSNGPRRSQGFEPGKFVIWFRQGDEGQLSAYTIFAAHPDPEMPGQPAFEVKVLWVRGQTVIWEVPRESRPWYQDPENAASLRPH